MKRNFETIFAGCQSRYDLDSFNYNQLRKDYIRFEQKVIMDMPNKYINRILTNYLTYKHDTHSPITALTSAEIHKLKQKQNCKELKLTINKDFYEQLKKLEFIELDDTFKDASIKKRDMINAFLNEYCSLELAEREKIYFYEYYTCIQEAINNQQILVISRNDKNGHKITFEYKPIMLGIDDNSYSYYFVGYSKMRGSTDDFSVFPTKLSNIKECYTKYKNFSISSKEVNIVKNMVSDFGIAYASSKTNLITAVVRLSYYGYNVKYLKSINHQRPIPVEEPKEVTINGKTFFELKFECSEMQIINYFFSFEKDAEILEPASLKEKFIQKYCDSLKAYSIDINTERRS